VSELRLTLRFDADTLASYRLLAKREGLTISDFLRRAVTHGVMAQEARAAVGELRDLTQALKDLATRQSSEDMRFQTAAVFAFVSEITRQRDPKAFEQMLKTVKAQMETRSANNGEI
jgi:hypothetical protein